MKRDRLLTMSLFQRLSKSLKATLQVSTWMAPPVVIPSRHQTAVPFQRGTRASPPSQKTNCIKSWKVYKPFLKSKE